MTEQSAQAVADIVGERVNYVLPARGAEVLDDRDLVADGDPGGAPRLLG